MTAVWKPLAHSSRYSYHIVLRKLLRSYGRPDLIRFVARLAKPLPSNGFVTADERDRLLAAAPPALRLAIMLASDCCLRISSALKFAPIHYDSETQTIHLGAKGGETIHVPVTAEIAHVLKHTNPPTQDCPYVAALNPRGLGNLLTINAVQYQFRKLRKHCGIDRQVTFHDFRRSTSDRAYSLTGDLRIVQTLLSHRNLSSTVAYMQNRLEPVTSELLETLKRGSK